MLYTPQTRKAIRDVPDHVPESDMFVPVPDLPLDLSSYAAGFAAPSLQGTEVAYRLRINRAWRR